MSPAITFKPQNKTFAIVDCNNFYASCERVFRPDLKDKPVAVLSNNDGIIVARSEEVKALGIPMAAPVFKYKDVLQKHNVQVFSSNYTLYADMSNRVMQTLRQFTPEMEIYSIDEAFLAFENLAESYQKGLDQRIRNTVQKWTGIPISVGIGPSKTLAKAANHLAKKLSDFDGTLDLTNHPDTDKLLKQIKVGKIWGVGRQYSKKLNMHGIYNAKQLRDAPEEWVRRRFTITGLRTVLELRGISCIQLEQHVPAKKQILRSRSFGAPVSDLQPMLEAVASYTAYAAEDLRRQGLATRYVSVFIHTNPFKETPQYANCATLSMPEPCDYTPELTDTAHKILRTIYKPGYQYKKAGVFFTELTPASEKQLCIFRNPGTDPRIDIKNSSVMEAIDQINAIWGRSTIKTAAEGIHQGWKMKRESCSQRYTTSWHELLSAKT